MHPTRLNLLPPDNKKYLQKMIFTEFIKNTLESLLFFLCLSGIILIAGQWVMDEHFSSLAANIVSVTNRQGQANLQIKEINAVLRQTKQIQERYSLWTPVISDFAANLPAGITLSQLASDNAKGVYYFTGRAKTRNDLLDFKSRIEALPFISSLQIPPAQLTKKENIDFALTALR